MDNVNLSDDLSDLCGEVETVSTKDNNSLPWKRHIEYLSRVGFYGANFLSGYHSLNLEKYEMVIMDSLLLGTSLHFSELSGDSRQKTITKGILALSISILYYIAGDLLRRYL